MRCSEEVIQAAREEMRRIERHVATKGITDTLAFDTHVVELVTKHWSDGAPGEPFRSELIEWGLYMVRTKPEILREELQAKHGAR